MTVRLGEWLIGHGRITAEQLDAALRAQDASSPSRRLGEILLEQGVLKEEDLLDALGEQFHATVLRAIPDTALERGLVKGFPVDFLRARPMIPLRIDGQMVLCSPDPSAVLEHPEFSVVLGQELEPVLAPEALVRKAIDQCYALREEPGGKQDPEEPQMTRSADREDLLRVSENAPVAAQVNRMVLDALEQGASDLHLDPRAGGIQLRYRIDGILREQTPIPRGMEDALVSRIKIMAHLDIAERRLPQDGNARVSVGAREVDIRVSTIPVTEGERVVLRLLGRESTRFSLEDLGMSPELLGEFRQLIQFPHGVIWVTGPTGSGKTTTLYAALQELDTEHRNVLTIEDPVEYQLPSIGQMNVMPRIGLTFAAGLRHLLRQDPDVILVGETRDEETAEIVVRASMTGHLVFSTLHANDAASASVRVTDMGVAPYLVAEASRGALAQRLVRRLCPSCGRVGTQAAPVDWPGGPEDFDGALLPEAVGCAACHEGYKGRVGLFELMRFTPELASMIREKRTAAELRQAASRDGFRNVWADAALKIREGMTTPDEVMAVLGRGV